MTTAQEKPGLQAERTLLSWERSAIGFLAGGAIPLLREAGPLAVGRTVLVVMAALLAMLVLALGKARARRIGTPRVVAGRSVVPAPRVSVLVLGSATAGFAATIVVLMLLR